MTADYAALGLYDPDAPHAEERLLLIEFLVGQGATIDDLVAYRDQLPGLASVIALRGGRALSLAEVVERSGLPEEKVRRLNRAAGFPDPGEDDRVFAGEFADAFGSVAVAEGMF